MNFQDFSHFIQIWLFPPGLVILLFVLGCMISYRAKKVSTNFIVIAFLMLWLLSTPIVAQFLIDQLQYRYMPLSSIHLVDKHHSAIVILGGGVENALEYQNKAVPSATTFSRIHYAAYLYRQTHLPIIASGGNRSNIGSIGRTEAEIIQDELNTNNKILIKIIENKSKTTKEESQLLMPLLQQHQLHTIFLVTNAWHMPRSMYIFNLSLQNMNIQTIPAPMGYIFIKSGYGLYNYLPLLKALNISVIAMHEYLGIAWYRLVSQK